ncbi:hypothetical protein, partial [Bordetella muralis]|uniref:hypothetical protein n=1 Tax=Bordetella muralis TaxID=1649130 RepID=UPI0039F03CFF
MEVIAAAQRRTQLQKMRDAGIIYLVAQRRRHKDKTPRSASWRGFEDKSLTMTYFHKRMFTIIGAKAFHC